LVDDVEALAAHPQQLTLQLLALQLQVELVTTGFSLFTTVSFVLLFALVFCNKTTAVDTASSWFGVDEETVVIAPGFKLRLFVASSGWIDDLFVWQLRHLVLQLLVAAAAAAATTSD
jgi:hypothetical protein